MKLQENEFDRPRPITGTGLSQLYRREERGHDGNKKKSNCCSANDGEIREMLLYDVTRHGLLLRAGIGLS